MATDTPSASRASRLRAVVDELILRREAGERVTDEAMISAHRDLMPELAEQLRFLNLVQVASDTSGRDRTRSPVPIRCPECHQLLSQPRELDARVLQELQCNRCGARFRYAEEQDESSALEGERLAGFLLLEKIGTGAFGSVYLAHDAKLNRHVAIKVPRKAHLSDSEASDFMREAQVAATLKHPNIVRVHEVGTHEGRIYLVTDYVDGSDLSQWIALVSPSSDEAASICAKLADALHHAHSRNVIHRDLKPSNVMLDQSGEPFLLDFGLAKHDAGGATVTLDGKLLGTPAYMSPEQARGTAARIDHRTDIYSLGVVLFELLTGQRPFQGGTRILLHQILFEDAPSPRRWSPSIPRDLETICLKCLEKDPARRYPTAEELGRDLQRFLRREPVLARPIGRLQRGLRWCYRNPRVALLSAFTGTLLLMLAVFGPLAAWSLRQQTQEILTERQRADDVERQRRLEQIERLLSAAPDRIQSSLDEIHRDRERLLPELQARYRAERLDPRGRLRLAYALAMFGEPDWDVLVDAALHAPTAEQTHVSTVFRALGKSACPPLLAAFARESDPNGRARLASLLLANGDPGPCREVLAFSEDPTTRLTFIFEFPALRGDLDALPMQLRQEADSAFRSGVCCGLGMLNPQTLDAELSAKLLAALQFLASASPDAATHSAARWALLRWGERPEVESSVTVTAAPDERSWFVNPQGMTMVRIEPGAFGMGDPQGGPVGDGQTVTAISRGFWISDAEITLGQYQQFLAEKTASAADGNATLRPVEQVAPLSRSDLHPVALSWYEAAEYCNWLSRAQGRTPCYAVSPRQPELWHADYDANGYRMPTDAEWEYVCRAGAKTSYATGSQPLVRLIDIGHIVAREAAVGRTKLPNAWGVFDMLGNSWEWCSDVSPLIGARRWMVVDPRGELPPQQRTLRGGAYDSGTWDLFFGRRHLEHPSRITKTHGFRVVCYDPRTPLQALDAPEVPGSTSEDTQAATQATVIVNALLKRFWADAQHREQLLSGLIPFVIPTAERIAAEPRMARIVTAWPSLKAQFALLRAYRAADRHEWELANSWYESALHGDQMTSDLCLDHAYALIAAAQPAQAQRMLQLSQQRADTEHACLAFSGQGEHVVAPYLPLHEWHAFTIELWTRHWEGQLLATGQASNGTAITMLYPQRKQWNPLASPLEFAEVRSQRWQHHAFVFAGDWQQFYVDGVPCGVSAASKLPADPDQLPILIGYGTTRPSPRGLIRTLRISQGARYQEAFVPAERLEIDADTLLYYDFDLSYGSVIPDRSGHERHGRLVRPW